MHMHIDQPWKNRLAGGIDRLGLERFRIGKCAVVNLGNLATFHEHRARLDHLAVTDKNARVLNQPRLAAAQIARQDLRLDEVMLAPRLISTEEEKPSETISSR